jgi:hypothetical protein
MQIPDAKLDSDGSEGVVVARDLNRERKTEVESKEGASSTEIASKAAGAKPFTLGATEDTETIGVIDDQFQHLWKRLDIETKVLTEREQLEDRIGRIVIGRTPTSAERESVRKSAKSTRDAIEQLANKWIASEEFDQHWADVLAGYYVGVSGKSTADSGRQAFVSWLQQAIHRNEPIGGIERSMVTADPEEISTHPEAYWVKHWLESWKGSEQLILDSGSHKAVGLNRNQLGSLETLAMQSFKMAGKSTAACSHCHTEDSKSLSDRAEWSKNLSRFEGGRESGLFAGLAAVWSTVAGAAKPDFFLADAEDRLAIVAPLFPDGKRVISKQDRRVALGEWFEGAVSARQSLVDLVWTQSFGPPLVPPLGLTDEEGFGWFEAFSLLDCHVGSGIRNGSVVRWRGLSYAGRGDARQATTQQSVVRDLFRRPEASGSNQRTGDLGQVLWTELCHGDRQDCVGTAIGSLSAICDGQAITHDGRVGSLAGTACGL